MIAEPEGVCAQIQSFLPTSQSECNKSTLQPHLRVPGFRACEGRGPARVSPCTLHAPTCCWQALAKYSLKHSLDSSPIVSQLSDQMVRQLRPSRWQLWALRPLRPGLLSRCHPCPGRFAQGAIAPRIPMTAPAVLLPLSLDLESQWLWIKLTMAQNSTGEK